ncbi:MAG: arginine--tRNA ligase [Ruminococcaceae bacterium]|nr:arginine--tRNA ligase [Oscillospiraceae bacterium]
MQNLKSSIAKKISETIAPDAPESMYSDIIASLEYPPDPTMGDLALPCFRFAKLMRKSPVMIAESLASSIEIEGIGRIEAVKGYLNFFISNDYLAKTLLPEILEKKDMYGSSDEGRGKTVVLDYSSPNVAKPFHIGHLGTTVIGHSLKLLHTFCGYDCVGVNHLGDWGTQFGKLITAFNLWGNREEIENGGIDALVALYVKYHEEAEKDESLNDRAREEFHKLELGDEKNIELWKWFIEISIAEYKKTYAQLGIEFDSYKGEAFYSDKMMPQVEKIREKGLLKIDDGASIVDLSDYNMPPCLILKRDGSTLYPTRDIAAAVYRKETYDFDKVIYVTSAGQSLHFAQWFKVVELMGYDWAKNLVHVPYGTVSIGGAKLATRTGNVILLRDLFADAVDKVRDIINEKNPNLENKEETAEAVGVGAIVFYYLLNTIIKDINFNMDDALSFEGNTGPYAQYTYARTCSLLSKAEDARSNEGKIEISAPEEASMLKVLSRFPETVLKATHEYEPSYITRYILDVCTGFNRFYHECPINSAEDASVRASRIKITEAVNYVLGRALSLICLKTPKKI